MPNTVPAESTKEDRIKVAGKILGKGLAKLGEIDPELRARIAWAIAREVEAFRSGR